MDGGEGQLYGPLTRYGILLAAHAPGMRERFDRQLGLAIPICIMARA